MRGKAHIVLVEFGCEGMLHLPYNAAVAVYAEEIHNKGG